MSSVRLRLAGIERDFGPFALNSVTLDVARHECLVVLGPSGSGKTTLLRIVAGLESPDAGRVLFDDRDVTHEPPQRRRAGVVFAEDALFPHMTAAANIAYGVPGGDPVRVRAAATTMHVEAFLERAVSTLSGGERQRVALARALAIEPALLLLDEPFARLDAPLRVALRLELKNVVRDAYTTVLVTHDQSEAMALGDRIAVMRDGRIEQAGTPRDLYERPASMFVATFVGSPAMSLLPSSSLPFTFAHEFATAGIRAGAVRIVAHGDGDLEGIVRSIEDLGADAYAYIETPVGAVVADVRGVMPAAGARVSVAIDRAKVHAFDADGRRVEAVVRV